jgi:O-methyltransferase
MATWSRLLRNPKSKLHGFDSFESLPETWDLGSEKGHFTTQGVVPVIDDPRVTFFRGWFSETLPRYVFPSHEQLFVMFDADLYSSTKTVLDFLKPHICLGTYPYIGPHAVQIGSSQAFVRSGA